MSQPANAAQTRWILFGAFIMSLAVQAGMGFFLRAQGGQAPMPPETLTTMTLVLAIAGVTLSGLSQMAPRLFKTNYLTMFILRLAFSEAVGLFGFLLFYLGASELIYLGFLGWAVLLILLAAPTESSEREFERQLEKR